MTLRHVLTIFVALAGIGVIGAVITSACRRLWDWREQRAYVPPPLFTEVHDLDQVTRSCATDAVPTPPSPAAHQVSVPPTPADAPSMWALTQFAKARALADGRVTDENLAEFAGRVATEIPVIGCELDMLFTLRRAAVPA